MNPTSHSRSRQQGISLIMSLIMLVLLTMVALSTFNLGKGGLQLVDNAQQRSQAQNAAQVTIDTVISSSAFVNNPTTVLDNGNCPTALNAPANSTCTDLYGDGKTVINVALSPTPACVQAKTVPQSSLDVTKSEDLGCTLGVAQNFGIANTSSSGSLCSDSVWEINAAASEATSNAKALITQAVKMRVSTDAVATSCP